MNIRRLKECRIRIRTGILTLILSAQANPLLANCNFSEELARDTYVYQPVDGATTASRIRLQNTVRRLDSYLLGSDTQRGSDWRAYLLLDDLTRELQNGQTSRVPVLEKIRERFYGAHPGLEREPLLAVRSELRRYINLMSLLQNHDPAAELRRRVLAAQTAVRGLQPADLGPEDTDLLTTLKGWLSDTGQAARLNSCLGQTFVHGNLGFSIGINLASLALNETIRESTPVREFSFGSWVTGTAYTNAHARLRFFPDAVTGDTRAVIEGTTDTNTRTTQQRVTVSTRIVTNFAAHQKFRFDGERLYAESPRTGANSKGWVTSVYADRLIGRHIAERIALRRANSVMPQAEAKASQRVMQQSAERLSQRLNAVISKVNTLYQEFAGAPLKRRGFAMLTPSGSSSSAQMRGAVVLSKVSGMGAPVPAPAVTPGQDLQLAVHETTVKRTLEELFAAGSVTDIEVERFVETMFGTVPPDLRVTAGNDRFEFTFAKDMPVAARFRNQALELTLRISEFSRNSADPDRPLTETYNGGLEITGRYRVIIVASGIRLRREGPLLVRPMRAMQQDLRTFLGRKADSMFGPELLIPHINLPENRVTGGTRPLRFVEARLTSGWLTLGAIIANH